MANWEVRMDYKTKLKNWFIDTIIRMIKTAAEVGLTFITLGAVANDVKWKMMVSAMGVSLVYTLLLNVSSLPKRTDDLPEQISFDLIDDGK